MVINKFLSSTHHATFLSHTYILQNSNTKIILTHTNSLFLLFVIIHFVQSTYLCFYALFVILLKIYYLLSNKLFINVLSLCVLMPRPWSHFAPFFVTVTTEQINTTVILIYNNNHIYMQQPVA